MRWWTILVSFVVQDESKSRHCRFLECVPPHGSSTRPRASWSCAHRQFGAFGSDFVAFVVVGQESRSDHLVTCVEVWAAHPVVGRRTDRWVLGVPNCLLHCSYHYWTGAEMETESVPRPIHGTLRRDV